jgi:hypothetical protein
MFLGDFTFCSSNNNSNSNEINQINGLIESNEENNQPNNNEDADPRVVLERILMQM